MTTNTSRQNNKKYLANDGVCFETRNFFLGNAYVFKHNPDGATDKSRPDSHREPRFNYLGNPEGVKH